MTVAPLAAAPAAQTSIPEEHPYGLDPYKPSDAAILRTWQHAGRAKTQLEAPPPDPHKPSHAALLRQLGNGVPQWSHFSWYPGAPVPAPPMMPSAACLDRRDEAGWRSLATSSSLPPRSIRVAAPDARTPARAAPAAAAAAEGPDPSRAVRSERPST
jgi:hypothetical protein